MVEIFAVRKVYSLILDFTTSGNAAKRDQWGLDWKMLGEDALGFRAKIHIYGYTDMRIMPMAKSIANEYHNYQAINS